MREACQSQELTRDRPESVKSKYDTDQIRQNVSVIRLNHAPWFSPLNLETNLFGEKETRILKLET